MHVIRCRNVNDALPQGVEYLLRTGLEVIVRGQKTLESPVPVCTRYERPRERVLFDPIRDANPFFHFFESLWILAGRNDVEYLEQFNSKIHQFSDNGLTFHGAYGHRLRFPYTPTQNHTDQLREVVERLKKDPTTRQAVMQIWMPYDLVAVTKDPPCNLTVHFLARGGYLNMTVFCRSNDIVWGAYGANVVQFSVIQEFVASACGLQVGIYNQISDSYHGYSEREDWGKLTRKGSNDYHGLPRNDYQEIGIDPYPMVLHPDVFLRECGEFVKDRWTAIDATNPFFRGVALPMYNAWIAHKETKLGLIPLMKCEATDWREAGAEWLRRRGES